MRSAKVRSKEKKLREALINCRRSKEITQQQLAKLLARPQSFVSKYESGERDLKIPEFLDICEALDADPHALIKLIIAT
jgi:transcriptional regulator with XRE-family HTH domain